MQGTQQMIVAGDVDAAQCPDQRQRAEPAEQRLARPSRPQQQHEDRGGEDGEVQRAGQPGTPEARLEEA